MRPFGTILLICSGMAALAPAIQAEVLQSSKEGGTLWATHEGAELRISRFAVEEMRVALPPGALIRDLESTADGWVAAGRLPAGEGTDLLILEGGPDGTELLPVPQRGPERYRGQPVLFLEGQELVGLAWAAGNGSRELEIWAAGWQNGEWGPPELVAARGPGSQLAPAGAVLADGSWLLVWAAFDGQDDEIVGSRRVDGRWTKAKPIHPGNEVPDLTPDVVALEDGAQVVWSGFDGRDYRLRFARWRDGLWQQFPTFGEKGSGGPRWIAEEDRVLLVYSSVVPPLWTVLEMDRRGWKTRVARVQKDTYTRPLVVMPEGGKETLRWEDDERILEWRELP